MLLLLLIVIDRGISHNFSGKIYIPSSEHVAVMYLCCFVMNLFLYIFVLSHFIISRFVKFELENETLIRIKSFVVLFRHGHTLNSFGISYIGFDMNKLTECTRSVFTHTQKYIGIFFSSNMHNCCIRNKH